MSEVVVGVKLKADGSGLVSEVKVSEKAWQDLKKEAGAAGASMEKAGESGKRGAKETTRSVGDMGAAWAQARNLVLGYISATQAVSIAREFVAQSDAMTLVNARLRQASTTAAEFRDLQRDLFSSAQRLGGSYVELAASAARMTPAIQALGGGAREAAKLAEIVIATAKIQGSTAQEAAAAAQQFAQALGSGVLQGDELKSILENNQKLARLLAEGLGVGVGQLKQMGAEGKLTSDAVASAVLKSYQKIQAEAANIPMTFEAGMQRLQNASALASAQMNDQIGVTKTLGTMFGQLAAALEVVTAKQEGAARSGSAVRDAANGLAYALAVVLDVFRVGAAAVELLGSTLVTFGVQIAGVSNIVAGAGVAILGALTLDKDMINAGLTRMSSAVKVMADDMRGLAGQTKALWNKPLLADAVQGLDGVARSTRAAATEQTNLAAGTDMAAARWKEATKDIKSVSTVTRDYKDELNKLDAAYKQQSAAAAGRYKTDAAMAAAQSAIDREYSEQKSGLNRKLQAELEAIAKANTVSFEKRMQQIEAEMESVRKKSEFEQKLRAESMKNAMDFEDFKRQLGVQTAEETLANRNSLQQQAFAEELAGLRKNYDEQTRLERVAQAQKTIGKEELAAKENKLRSISEERAKIEREMVLVIERQSQATVKYGQEADLLAQARLKERIALNRSVDDTIRGYTEQAQAQQEQIDLIGKSAAEVARLSEQRRIDLEIVKQTSVMERALQDARLSGKSQSEIDALREKHQAVLDVLTLQRGVMPQIAAGIVSAKEETQKWLDLYRTLDSAFQAAFTSVLNGTKTSRQAIRDLGRTIRDELLRALYEATAKKWLVSIVANVVGGSTGQSIVNAASGSNGLLGNIFSAAGGGGSLLATVGGAAATGLNALGFGGASQFVGGLTGAIAGPALPGSALAMGQSIGGALAAAGPFVAIAAALYGINQFLNSRRGGEKEGGSYLATYGADGGLTGVDSRRFYTPNSMDSQFTSLATGVADSFFSAVRRFGATTSGATFGIGGDTDPRGSAQSRVSGVSWVNGREVYYNQGRDIGRDSSRYGAEYELEAKRMLASALKAAIGDSDSVAKPIKDLFAAFKVEGSTLDDINKLLSAAETIQQIIDALSATGITGLDYDALVGFQREGEALAETFTRVTNAVATFNDMFTTSAEKENATVQSFRSTMEDLGLAIPDTADGFRSLVRGLDLSTASGRAVFEALMAAAPAARTYYDVIERGAQEAADAAAEAQAEAARVAEEALQKLRDRIASVQSFIASIGDDMFSIRSAQPGFDAVGYWGGQVGARRTAFNAATTTEDRLQAGGQLRQAILSRREAERAEAQRDHDTRIAAINRERELVRAVGEERIQNERAALDAAKQAAQQLKEAYKAIGEFAKSLLLSEYSPLTDRQRLEEASSQYSAIAARARSGDLSAVGQYTGGANAYLKELKNYYAVSSEEYQTAFRRVQSEAAALGLQGDALDLSAYESQALALDREQNELQRQLNEFDALTAAADADLQARMLEIDETALEDLQGLSDSMSTHLSSLQDTLDEQLLVTRQNGEAIRAVEQAVVTVQRAVLMGNSKAQENTDEIAELRTALEEALARLGRRLEAASEANG